MPKILGRLRRQRERIAEETLERLDSESEHGPDAARRFREAARKVVTFTKTSVTKRGP